MISDSPHLYLAGLPVRKTPPEVARRALQQASAVEQQGLASVLTLGHLAHSTGSSHAYLRRVVSRAIDPYDDLSVPKRSSRKMRTISSPKEPLLSVQRWILTRILSKIPTHPNSFAYTPGNSIKACARRHLGATWLVKLDIRNFFESISEAQAYDVFRGAGYRPLPSLELSRICTRHAMHRPSSERSRFQHRSIYRTIRSYRTPYLGYLPQGAPTSGALANLVSRRLDEQLTSLAQAMDLVYTRYADDMTFSSIAPFQRRNATRIINSTADILSQYGFEQHKQKTRIVSPGARKIVLGLLVDGDDIRLNREMRARVIWHLRGVETFGLACHVKHARFSSQEGLVRHVSGLLAFANDIEPGWSKEIAERWTTALQRSGWR